MASSYWTSLPYHTARRSADVARLSILCCAVSEADEGSKAAELPFHAPNVWPDPDDAPLFRPAFTAYRAALIGVRDK